jgi:hypothetical protein
MRLSHQPAEIKREAAGFDCLPGERLQSAVKRICAVGVLLIPEVPLCAAAVDHSSCS